MKITLLGFLALISTTAYCQPQEDKILIPRPVVEWFMENITINELLKKELESSKQEIKILEAIIDSDSVRITTYQADSVNLIEERTKTIELISNLEDQAKVQEDKRKEQAKNFWKERILYILIIVLELGIILL